MLQHSHQESKDFMLTKGELILAAYNWDEKSVSDLMGYNRGDYNRDFTVSVLLS